MALMLLLASCGEEKDVRTAIPRDARAVLAVDWASMAEKGGLADPSVSQPLTEWMSRTVSADDKEYVEDLMADPGKSGIDFRQKLYAFTNDKKDVGVLMKIDSKKRFKKLLRHIDEAWADAAWESEGGADCLELPEGVIVVDDDMAMMVSSAGDATTEAMRMRGVRWLEQKPEESFTATGSCVAMEEDSADVALWCTLGALFDVTGNQALAANLPRDVRPDDIHCLMCLDFDRAMRLNASIRPMSDAAEAYCDEQGRMVKSVKGTFLPDASAPFWLWAASSVDGQQLARLLERNAEERIIIRRQDRRVTVDESSNIKLEIVDFGEEDTSFMYMTVGPESTVQGLFWEHEFDEAGTVISGRLIIGLEDKEFELNEGDTILIKAHTRHCYYTGDEESVSFWARYWRK